MRKTCTKCGVEKDWSDFTLQNGRPISRCKPCSARVGREKRAANFKPKIIKTTKVCTRCEIEKDKGEFYKESGRCKPCCKIVAKGWAKENQERRKEISRTSHKTNREKESAAAKARYRVDLEKSRAKARENQRLYAERHGGQAAVVRANRLRNPDTAIAATHRRRERERTGGGSFTGKEWKALKDHYGNQCLCCSKTGVKLQPDHVIPVALFGPSYIWNIQPLCGKCNRAKGKKCTDYRPRFNDDGSLKEEQRQTG